MLWNYWVQKCKHCKGILWIFSGHLKQIMVVLSRQNVSEYFYIYTYCYIMHIMYFQNNFKLLNTIVHTDIERPNHCDILYICKTCIQWDVILNHVQLSTISNTWLQKKFFCKLSMFFNWIRTILHFWIQKMTSIFLNQVRFLC